MSSQSKTPKETSVLGSVEKEECQTGCSQQMENSHSDFEQEEHYAMNLLDLPWEQILCKHVLPFLSTKDLFKLRAVSRLCHELLQTYFCLAFEVNTSPLQDKFTSSAFKIMTRDSTCLKVLSTRGAKSWLTTSDIAPVLESNPKLERIDLSGCLALSGATMYCIGVNCDSLKYLSLRDCVWLSFENFMSFLSKPRLIEFLDLSGCWNLDDELLVQLASCCPKLKHLLLMNLYGLTDRSVATIARCCPNLVQLSIKGCWRVTDSSIRVLSQYCKKLKVLNVKECRDITEDSLCALRARKVHIDKLAPPSINQYRLEYLSKNQHRLNLVL